MEAPALRLIILALATCSCMAVLRGAPDPDGSRAMELREGAHNLTSTKQLLRTSTDTLNGEERGPYDYFRSISSPETYQSLTEHLLHDTFVPPILKSPEENYLGTREFATRAKPFLESSQPYDTIMTGMRELHDDVVVANIIAIGMRKSETKDLAITLGDSQIRQWIREHREPEAVFKLLELNKNKGLYHVFEDPLFNTWAEFVLKRERLQQNEVHAAASAALIPETALVREKLNSLYKETLRLYGKNVDFLGPELTSHRKRIGLYNENLYRLRVKALKFADADGKAYREMVRVLMRNKYDVKKLNDSTENYHMDGIRTVIRGPAKY